MRTHYGCRSLGLCIALLGIVVGTLGASSAAPALATQFESPLAPPASALALTPRAYLPLITRPTGSTCTPTGQTYGTLKPIDPATGDVSRHPDMNLAVRGYIRTTAYLGLVDYAGNIDPNA